MNLNKQMELATAIFGSEPTTGVERVSATATADSADGEVTVQFEDGSTLAVPVTGAVKSGDEVIVNVQQGTPIAAGAAGWGDRVQTVADEAQAVAEATNQHFWDDSNGAHVTEVEQDAWTDPTSPSYHTGRDILLNSSGILLREDYANLASFTPSAVAFYDGSGDATATFGTNGAVIGRTADGDSRTEISTSGMHIYQRSNGADTAIADMGYGLGTAQGGGTANAPYYTLGYRESGTAVGNYSVAEGARNEVSGFASHAEGVRTSATDEYAHAEGYVTTASREAAHAEGISTTASGVGSHAEGYMSNASGQTSHAEGYNAVASGYGSHAQNNNTIAAKLAQTAIGTYNIEDTSATTTHQSGSAAYGEFALIVGNGTDTPSIQRSNAFTVAWNGDIEAAGEVIDGYGNKLSDAGGYKFVRFIPTSAAAQSMSTTTSSVNAITVVDAGDSSLVTSVGSGAYEFAEAGTYRISAQCGMYPNTTAKTRLCVGLYDTDTSGTRLALGVQQMYNATANSASQVVTVACEYVGVFAAGDRVALGAFADVTAAKVTRGGSGDLTRITFEKVG